MADDEYEKVKKAIEFFGACQLEKNSPGIYVKDDETYVVVGKQIDVKKAGIEGILGEGDVAIEVSKSLVQHAP